MSGDSKLTSRIAPASHFYYSQRLRLHYLDWGNEDSPHLMFVHGIRDHARSWDRVADTFQDTFHIVVPDLRGHGDSAWSLGSTYSFLEYVCDIEQLVRQRSLDNLTIVGHSMGGTVAALFAGIYPERVGGLVMIEPIGIYPELQSANPAMTLRGWIASNRDLAARIPKKYESVEEAFHRMQTANPHLKPDFARYLTIHGSHQNEDGTYSWKFDNHTRTGTPYEIPNRDMIALWERVNCPVLIINSRDGYPHRIGHEGTLRHFRNVKLEVLDDAGHWTHHDRLTEVSHLIGTFANEIARIP